MKSTGRYIFLAVILTITVLPAFPLFKYTDNLISNVSLKHDGSKIIVSADFDLSGIKMNKTQGAVFVPLLINGKDTLALPEVGLYGRTRWYKLDRAQLLPPPYSKAIALQYKDRNRMVHYKAETEFEDWMNGAELFMKYVDYGCANCQSSYISPVVLARCRETPSNLFTPEFIYAEAEAEAVKMREMTGKAYIDFPVGQTVIRPDFRNNAFELYKIINTIDSVKKDKDISVTSLSIKGFASPEGAYENNARLAMGRTDALKEYVRRLYNFPYGFISTSYEPEDWQGLREWVMNSNISYKYGILDIIDSYLPPDEKNTKIQNTYPSEYRFLLDYVYPTLRRSDYKIEYTIRQFSDIKEIEEIYKVSPQKLSLSEIYTLAKRYIPGTEDYNEIFKTAVKLFPNDEIANLNAANSEMSKGNLTAAAFYLEKAGDSPETTYAKGILAALQGDRDKAETLIQWAFFKGLNRAEPVLQHLKNSKLPGEK